MGLTGVRYVWRGSEDEAAPEFLDPGIRGREILKSLAVV